MTMKTLIIFQRFCVVFTNSAYLHTHVSCGGTNGTLTVPSGLYSKCSTAPNLNAQLAFEQQHNDNVDSGEDEKIS